MERSGRFSLMRAPSESTLSALDIPDKPTFSIRPKSSTARRRPKATPKATPSPVRPSTGSRRSGGVATMPPLRHGGPRSDYSANDHVFMDSQPSWQRRMEKVRGLRYRKQPSVIRTQPGSPTRGVSSPSSQERSPSGTSPEGIQPPSGTTSVRGEASELVGSQPVVTGLSQVLSGLDANTTSILRGHLPTKAQPQRPSAAAAISMATTGEAGTTTGTLYQSPFMGEEVATAGASGDFKGIKARQKWMGMNQMFGSQAVGSELAKYVAAAGSVEQRAALEEANRRKAVRDARARQHEVSLAKGDPEALKTAYLLSRMGKSQREFDDDWMADAYKDGGTHDAITNYAPIPLADRLAKRKENVGASKLDLLKSIVGIDSLDPGRNGEGKGLAKLLGSIGMADVQNSPFVSLPDRLKRQLADVAAAKDDAYRKAEADKRKEMMGKLKTADSFVLNFEFQEEKKPEVAEPSDSEHDSDSSNDVWRDHKRMPGTGHAEVGAGAESEDDMAAVGRGDDDVDDEFNAYFGEAAKEEMFQTYRSLARRDSALFDRPMMSTADPLPKPRGYVAPKAEDKDSPVRFEKQRGMWEDPVKLKHRESLMRTASGRSVVPARPEYDAADDEDDDASTVDTATAFNIATSSSSESDSDTDSSQLSDPDSDDMEMTQAEKDARREVKFLESALASRKLVEAAKPLQDVPHSPDEGDVHKQLRRLRMQASKAHRISKLAKIAKSKLSRMRKAPEEDDVNPVIVAHYANKFPATQSVLHSYLRHCRDNGIAPETFILRKSRSTTLNLGHFSLGSARARALATALGALPMLQHLNLEDNRLSDADLGHLMAALTVHPSLLSLDLSSNHPGKTSVPALCELVRSSAVLTRLSLAHCALGSQFTTELATAIENNDSVTLLDLSHNNISPSAGVALGAMLGNCELEELDLSWNQLGDGGVKPLCEVLGTNTGHLRWLNMAWNGISSTGASHLGTMLDTNTKLAHLDLSNNSIDPRGAMVLSDGIDNNTTIMSLQLNANPLGSDGCRAIMRAMRKARDKPRSIGLMNCTMQSAMVFDPNAPAGKYSLDLKDPYQRLVAQELVRLAESNPDVHFLGARWVPPRAKPPSQPIGTPIDKCIMLPESGGGLPGAGAGSSALPPVDGKPKRRRPEVVFLRMRREMAKVKFSTELWRALRGNLTDVADWIADQNKLGSRAAKDGLGRKARRHGGIMNAYFTPVDSDKQRAKLWEKREAAREKKEKQLSDAILADRKQAKLKKLKSYEKSSFEKLAEKNKEMSMSGVGLSNKNTFDKKREMSQIRWEDDEVDEGTADDAPKWMPPTEGTFQVLVRVSQESKDADTKSSKGAEVKGLMHLLHDSRSAGKLQDHDRLKLLELASMDMAIKSSDAAKLMQMDLLKKSSSGQRVHAMSRLLFRLVDPAHAMALLDTHLSEPEKREVQATLGQAFRLLIGQATGHYVLNLADAQDRDVLVRLLAVNKEERNWLRMRYPRLDTSQKGNGHRFRNEKLNGIATTVTPKSFEQIPTSGILELDFVTCRRPSSRAKTVHSLAFSRVLRKAGVYGLLSAMGVKLGDAALEAEAEAAAGEEVDGSQSEGAPRKGRKKSKGGKPAKQPATSTILSKGIKVKEEYKPPPLSKEFHGPPYHLNPLTETPNEWFLPVYHDYCKVKRRRVNLRVAMDVSAARGKGKGSPEVNRENDFGWLKKDIVADSEYDVTAAASEFDPYNFPEVFARAKCPPTDRAPTEVCTQAGYVLTDLISLCTNLWISSRQLSDLVRMFPRSLPGFRVEIVVALFNRVNDLSGMHRVLFALTMPERRLVRHRLGWLNIWDPMMPDGKYSLDLTVWEERVVAHALTQLAVSEPGDSWVDTSFNHIPGWRLPRMWLQSMPTAGLLEVTFTTLEPNCMPVWAERKRQCRKVLTYC